MFDPWVVIDAIMLAAVRTYLFGIMLAAVSTYLFGIMLAAVRTYLFGSIACHVMTAYSTFLCPIYSWRQCMNINIFQF